MSLVPPNRAELARQALYEHEAEAARILRELGAVAEERRREWSAASEQLRREGKVRRLLSRLRPKTPAEQEVERLRLRYEFAISRLEIERWALEHQHEQLVQVIRREGGLWPERSLDTHREIALSAYASRIADNVAVSIYLADEDIHEQVEAAIEHWLATANLTINTRGKPVIGSWFRRLTAGAKAVAGSPAAREALLTATHVADSRLVQAHDAYVTATLLQNVAPVLQALQPTKDAVVRAGALLIVKIDWVVQVHQLTAVQQAILDHYPRLLASPTEIAAALKLQGPVVQETTIQSAARREDGDGTAPTAAN